MVTAKTEDALLIKILITAGVFVLLLLAAFIRIGRMENDKKADLAAVFGIPFAFPFSAGSLLAFIEYYTDIYGYRENSFYELYVWCILLCFTTVMLFSASFWIFNRHSLGLRLSKYRDMRSVALKTMIIPLIVVGIYFLMRMFKS